MTRAHPAHRRFHDDPRTAVRVRTVAWIAAVTAVSLVLLVIAVSFILRATVANGIREGIDQEAGEIERFAEEAVDPATGASFDSAARFIEVYVARQESERGELMVAMSDGSSDTVEVRGRDAPAFAELDAESRAHVLTPGTTGTRTSPTVGTITWRNVEVRVADTSGVIVVIEFHASREAELRAQLGLLSALAVGALLATGVAAWWVAGRLERPVDRFAAAVAELAAGGPGSGRFERVPDGADPAYARLAAAGNALVDGAERAIEREQRFVDDVVHEIRAPLAIVRGGLERPPHDEAARARLHERSLDELRRLEALIAALAALTRAQRPGAIESEDVDTRGFVAALVAKWHERTIELRRADVRVVAEVVDGQRLTTDPARLERALDELIDNGVRASPPCGVVRVSASRIDGADGSRLVFEVEDEGRGVPADELEAVFERFVTASNAPSGGAGLGLAVARQLADVLGGSVTIAAGQRGERDAPTVARGAIARLELPIDEDSTRA